MIVFNYEFIILKSIRTNKKMDKMFYVSELFHLNSLYLLEEQKKYVRENCFLKIVNNDLETNTIFFDSYSYKNLYDIYLKKGFNDIQSDFISLWILVSFKYYENDFKDNTEHIFSLLLISKANIYEFYRKRDICNFYKDFLTQIEPKKSEEEIKTFISKKYRPLSYIESVQKMIPNLFSEKELKIFLKSFFNKSIPYHRLCLHCRKNFIQIWQNDDGECISCSVKFIINNKNTF